MCRVLNKHAAGKHHGAIYIGRGSKWGNPFRIGVDGDRAAVIAKHARWLRISITCCARSTNFAAKFAVLLPPAACHGDLLLRLANASREERIAWWRLAGLPPSTHRAVAGRQGGRAELRSPAAAAVSHGPADHVGNAAYLLVSFYT